MENEPTGQNVEEKKNELLILIAEIDKELSRLNREQDAEKIQRWQKQRKNIIAEIVKITGLSEDEIKAEIAGS